MRGACTLCGFAYEGEDRCPACHAPRPLPFTTPPQASDCPACGAALTKRRVKIGSGEDAEVVGIPHCRACSRDYAKDAAKYYEFYASRFASEPHGWPLVPGLRGDWDGREVELLGRVRYQDQEDYDNSSWDEWCLLFADGERAWLAIENGKARLFRRYRPKRELSLDKDGALLDGMRARAAGAYTKHVARIDGQLPWNATLGEASRCYTIKNGALEYSVEEGEDELEAWVGERVDRLFVLEAFGIRARALAHGKAALAGRKALLYGLAACAFLALAFKHCDANTVQIRISPADLASPDPQVVNTAKAVFASLSRSESSGNARVRYGPVRLDQADGMYRVVLRCGRLSHEWLNADLSLVDAADRTVFLLEGDFWHETGIDEGEHWDESDLSTVQSFVLHESGDYWFELEILSSNPQRSWRDITIILYRDQGVWSYPLVGGLFFLVLTLLCLAKRKRELS